MVDGQPGLFAIDGQRAVEVRRQPGDILADQGERGAGQHVAAARSLVAKDAVVEQRVGATVVDAEQRAFEWSLRYRFAA